MRGRAVYAYLLLALMQDSLCDLHHTRTGSCPNLVLRNGKVKRRQRGRFVKFVCNTGYMLAGEKFSTCVDGYSWDPSPPKCVRPTCVNKPSPPVNGLIYPTHIGAALHIYCKPGYEIRGPTDVYCDGRKWDNNMPICLATNTKPKLFCDFENEDLCGWSHDLNHVFDWRRENYNTPSGSIGTGPSFDHTKGPGQNGHYMYIESSSKFENDTARLISPIFDKTQGPTCLEFFYHMYGATTGSLRVYVKGISEQWSLNPLNAVFSKSGNQGNRWYRSYHDLGIISEEYQIVIEGVRGPGYVSDIAIDDVKIVENCVYVEETTTMEALYSTEALLQVESCENRCGHKASGNETHLITCDCDVECYDNNKCCPDYFDFCVSETTEGDYLSSTDMPNEVIVTDLAHPPFVSALPEALTVKPSTAQPIPITISRTTTARVTPKLTTAIISATKPSSAKPTTRATTKVVNTLKITQPTLPTIQLLTEPTRPVIVRKTLPPTVTPKKTKMPPVIYVKPKKTDKGNKENESNDVGDVPRRTDSDEELLLTSPMPEMDGKREWSPEDVEDGMDAPLPSNLGERDKFLSIKAPPVHSYNVVLIVISAVGIVVLTTVIAVIVIRRYRCSHRRMASSNGDSQSDVRFLTSDEVLDFSLDKDYDSL